MEVEDELSSELSNKKSTQKFKIPKGLRELTEELSITVIKNQPPCIYEHLSGYLGEQSDKQSRRCKQNLQSGDSKPKRPRPCGAAHKKQKPKQTNNGESITNHVGDVLTEAISLVDALQTLQDDSSRDEIELKIEAKKVKPCKQKNVQQNEKYENEPQNVAKFERDGNAYVYPKTSQLNGQPGNENKGPCLADGLLSDESSRTSQINGQPGIRKSQISQISGQATGNENKGPCQSGGLPSDGSSRTSQVNGQHGIRKSQISQISGQARGPCQENGKLPMQIQMIPCELEAIANHVENLRNTIRAMMACGSQMGINGVTLPCNSGPSLPPCVSRPKIPPRCQKLAEKVEQCTGTGAECAQETQALATCIDETQTLGKFENSPEIEGSCIEEDSDSENLDNEQGRQQGRSLNRPEFEGNAENSRQAGSEIPANEQGRQQGRSLQRPVFEGNAEDGRQTGSENPEEGRNAEYGGQEGSENQEGGRRQGRSIQKPIIDSVPPPPPSRVCIPLGQTASTFQPPPGYTGPLVPCSDLDSEFANESIFTTIQNQVVDWGKAMYVWFYDQFSKLKEMFAKELKKLNLPFKKAFLILAALLLLYITYKLLQKLFGSRRAAPLVLDLNLPIGDPNNKKCALAPAPMPIPSQNLAIQPKS